MFEWIGNALPRAAYSNSSSRSVLCPANWPIQQTEHSNKYTASVLTSKKHWATLQCQSSNAANRSGDNELYDQNAKFRCHQLRWNGDLVFGSRPQIRLQSHQVYLTMLIKQQISSMKKNHKVHRDKHKWIYAQWNGSSVTKPNPEKCKNCSSKCVCDCAQLQNTIQH